MDCSGHLEHVDLARPVYHPGLIRRVKQILECVCLKCCRLKMDPSDDRLRATQRIKDRSRKFKAVWILAKDVRVCKRGNLHESHQAQLEKGCNFLQPTFKRKGFKIFQILQNGKDNTLSNVSADYCRTIFERISDEEAALMGLSPQWARPENMMITVLLVPPAFAGSRELWLDSPSSNDDLLFALQNVVRVNERIKNLDAGRPELYNELYDLLQYYVAEVMDGKACANGDAEMTFFGPTSISSRLKSLARLLQGNLGTAKHTVFWAHSTATIEPNLDVDQIGIPRSVARQLTISETVTTSNMERLCHYVENNGAKCIVRQSGERFDLQLQSNSHIQPGDSVERHLMDGDVVFLCQRPSLQRSSNIGLYVKVMPCSSFRLNLTAIMPDTVTLSGEELSLHVPHSQETRAEVEELCMASRHVLSPQNGSPCVGLSQDALTGIAMLSQRDTFLNEEMVMSLMMWVTDWNGVIPSPAILRPFPLWTGKQIISSILPDINLDRPNVYDSGHNNASDLIIILRKGELLAGELDRSAVNMSGGLVHLIALEYGQKAGMSFIVAAQKVVNFWLLHHGFSIGIGDVVPSSQVVDITRDYVRKANILIGELLQKAREGTLERRRHCMSIREAFEEAVILAETQWWDRIRMKNMTFLRRSNSARVMATAGSSGSSARLGRAMACVGQQYLARKGRIPFGFRDRTLPHFTKFDESFEARGFVSNSFLQGLNTTEFFFHCQSHRHHLVESHENRINAERVQRYMAHTMENTTVHYDGTVRNSTCDVIQFLYGEDGMDPCHLKLEKLGLASLTEDKLERMYRFDLREPGLSFRSRRVAEFEEMIASGNYQQALDSEYAQIREDWQFLRSKVLPSNGRQGLPVNVKRLVERAKSMFNLNNAQVDLDSLTVLAGVRMLLSRIGNVCASGATASLLFQIMVRSTLSVKRVIDEYRLNEQSFRWILAETERQFIRAVVTPGENVGMIAAQSIGARFSPIYDTSADSTPSFYLVRTVDRSSLASGLARLQELLQLSNKTQNPRMEVGLLINSIESARTVRSKLACVTLESLIDTVEIWYDPDPAHPVAKPFNDLDQDIMSEYLLFEDETFDANSYSPWVLRIFINSERFAGFPMYHIATKLGECIGGRLQCWWSSDINTNLILARVRKEENEMEEHNCLQDLLDLTRSGLSKVIVGGIPNVRIAQIDQLPVNFPGHRRYYVETAGSNFREALRLDGVDPYSTTTNSVMEVFSVLGVEAARQVLLRELHLADKVDPRHLSLVADVICHRGYLKPMSGGEDFLATLSERGVEDWMEAAAAAELSECNPVSWAMALGQLPAMGTGCFEVVGAN
ncbi:hypothetical protein DFJ73DRAFT_822769 [Zopfochytrium polystomum]|nr:hypothetical protein DFJ73DRAFT_822769 [Zopfochytrium polystomum]